MHSRTDILAIFSTFIQFAGDRFDTWISDPRLARNMQQELLQNDDADRSEKFWALHWYRRQQHDPHATKHLWAYLQEPCYWAADRVTRRFAMVQCSLADGFQIAIANVDRILNGYNPDYGSTLKAYAHTAFGNCIRDQLRQQHEINISSDWGLLRRLSQTQLTQALLATGFIETAPYILIWQCFKAICTPEPGRLVRGLPAPNDEQFEAIAKRYNQMRHQLISELTNIDIGNQDINTQQLTMELIKLATIARAYLTPIVTSLNQPQYDDSGEEQLYTLPTHDNPMAQLLADEDYAQQQQYMKQIGEVLENALSKLDEPSQILLSLYYQQTYTQTDIARQLDIQQYQVSRKLSRIRRQLLLNTVNWSQETLHIPKESAILANVSEVIHEWLQSHYSQVSPQAPSEVSE
ncbi:sigma-70 family RNA polymerase sigma factor [Leptothoe spongobia]|uniref:Sigma-70 family RNA polymerase sigma factor n=1 Tax=Leptothoe spongobia TAU-MAC 1115 TaxID=1967444 RepID=A0A947DFA5_9CYAN|nr:sigma-70 family RNA polymerase sigma factor [Leptothoe spongobia]MBT9315845.1 sigma-70 family RNA polymerase sigma factor [Leptothoe spongobia TAU-MAC 1115]